MEVCLYWAGSAFPSFTTFSLSHMRSLHPFRLLAVGLSLALVSNPLQAQQPEAAPAVNAPAAGKVVKSLKVQFKGPASISEAPCARSDVHP